MKHGDGADPSLSLPREFCYSADRAVEVVEGATHVIVVTGGSTMLALGIVLNIIGLGFFCWVLFTLAIYALPFFVGMTAGLAIGAEGRPAFGAMGIARLAEAPRFRLVETRAVAGDVLHRWVRAPDARS